MVGVSRKTVRRALGNPAFPVPAPRRVPPPRPSKLDPYKAKIRYLVIEKKLSAIRVLEEIKDLGYPGGYSILKDYIRTIRPKAKRRPTTPIDHAPGHEAQMDWSPHRVIMGGREEIVQTGSLVLCFSRWLFFRHFTDQRLENVIRLHEEALKELGAVPNVITYDNMTTVGRHTGLGQVWINPAFKRFADEYGFKIIILRPGAKDRHGMVERPFHYIENNFLAGREFLDLQDLNRRADQWRENKANVRIHGSLRERPLDRLQRERLFLLPLPQNKTPDHFREVERLIGRDFSVAIDTNRYSASPHLAGHKAIVRLYHHHLEIWVEAQMDCRHVYCQGRYQRQVLPEHEEAFKKMTGQHQLLEQAFLRLGDQARTYFQGLKKERGGAAGYHLQRILKMADRHGADVVLGAMAHASRYGAFNAEAIMRLIHGRTLKSKGPIRESISVPKDIKKWLKSLAVEEQKPGLYDKLAGNTPKKQDDPEEDS